MAKITHAGITDYSFLQASDQLRVQAELNVSEKQVERVIHRVGRDRQEQRDAGVEQWQALPLPDTGNGRQLANAAIAVPLDSLTPQSLSCALAGTARASDARSCGNGSFRPYSVQVDHSLVDIPILVVDAPHDAAIE